MTNPNEARASVPVSDAVRELYIATSGMLDAADRANIRKGNWDGTTNMQAFARFKAETLERAAKIADGIGEAYGEDESGWLDCSETIAAAIRRSKGRPEELEPIDTVPRANEGSI